MWGYVFVDLDETREGLTPDYESGFVRLLLENTGANVFNAFRDDGVVFNAAIPQEVAKAQMGPTSSFAAAAVNVSKIAQRRPAARLGDDPRVLVASKLTRKIVPSAVEERSSLPPTSRMCSRIPPRPAPTPFPEVLKLSRISCEIP